MAKATRPFSVIWCELRMYKVIKQTHAESHFQLAKSLFDPKAAALFYTRNNDDGGPVWDQTYRRLLIFIACRLCAAQVNACYVGIYGAIPTWIWLSIYSPHVAMYSSGATHAGHTIPCRWAQSELTSNTKWARTKIYIDLSGMCTLAHTVYAQLCGVKCTESWIIGSSRLSQLI